MDEIKGGYDTKTSAWVGPAVAEVDYWRRRALAAEGVRCRCIDGHKPGHTHAAKPDKPVHSPVVVAPAGPNVRRDG